MPVCLPAVAIPNRWNARTSYPAPSLLGANDHPRTPDARDTASGAVYCCRLELRAQAGRFSRAGAQDGPQVELLSRNGRPLAVAFPEIVAALTALPVNAVLDCELVVVDQRGHPVWADSPSRAGRQPTWLETKDQDYARREALRFARDEVNVVGKLFLLFIGLQMPGVWSVQILSRYTADNSVPAQRSGLKLKP
jgi:hypothetical protein